MNNDIYLEYFNTIFIDDLLHNSCNEIFDIEYCNTCTHKLDAIFSENLSYDASMCTELAKYYIKITNLWHTIITTLNPVFNDDDIFLCEPKHVNNSKYNLFDITQVKSWIFISNFCNKFRFCHKHSSINILYHKN